MKHLLAPLLCLCCALPAAAAAEPSATELARWRRASACVAVLKADVVVLRERSLAGTAGLRPEMQRLTEQGFALVGTAYKQGLRNPLADQLLDEAEAAQKRQGTEALRTLSQECRVEGARTLKEASFIERALVANRARARVDQLLEPRR